MQAAKKPLIFSPAHALIMPLTQLLAILASLEQEV